MLLSILRLVRMPGWPFARMAPRSKSILSRPHSADMFSKFKPTWTAAIATAWPLFGSVPAVLKGFDRKKSSFEKRDPLSRPHSMLAGERTTLDFAYPGDVIGVINPGVFAIGDTLSVTGGFNFKPLPQFQPEIFAKLYPKDVAKENRSIKALSNWSRKVRFRCSHSPESEGELIYAAVGKLQFEVMQYRLKDEYGVETILTLLPYQCSAWIIGDMKTFEKSYSSLIVQDRQGRPMILFTDQWDKQHCIKKNPNHQLVDVLV